MRRRNNLLIHRSDLFNTYVALPVHLYYRTYFILHWSFTAYTLVHILACHNNLSLSTWRGRPARDTIPMTRQYYIYKYNKTACLWQDSLKYIYISLIWQYACGKTVSECLTIDILNTIYNKKCETPWPQEYRWIIQIEVTAHLCECNVCVESTAAFCAWKVMISCSGAGTAM